MCFLVIGRTHPFCCRPPHIFYVKYKKYWINNRYLIGKINFVDFFLLEFLPIFNLSNNNNFVTAIFEKSQKIGTCQQKKSWKNREKFKKSFFFPHYPPIFTTSFDCHLLTSIFFHITTTISFEKSETCKWHAYQ